MENSDQPQIAVSYSWKEEREGPNAGAVKKFCQHLLDAGIPVVRDTDRLKHGECIWKFMRDIGASQSLCIFLSDGYLRSPNCMYELLVAWQRSKDNPEELRSRIKVWVMPSAIGISDPEIRIRYLEHWQSERERLKPLINRHAADGLSDDELAGFNRIKEVADHVNKMLCFFANTLSPVSANEFLDWIFQQSGKLIAPELLENSFPGIVAEINRLLGKHRAVGEFLRRCAPDLFEYKSPDYYLNAVVVGRQSIDLVSVVDSVTTALKSEHANRGFGRALEEIMGGIIVLGVNPEWVVAQRILAKSDRVHYSGDDIFKTEGSDTVYFLELVVRALGDSCSRLQDVFRPPDDSDFHQIPTVSKVFQGVLHQDNLTTLKRLFIKHIKQREPLAKDVDRLFEEIKQSMADEKRRGKKQYYATDSEFQKYASEIKQDLQLEDLLLIFPSGGTEADMVPLAHLLVPRLCELFTEIKSLKEES